MLVIRIQFPLAHLLQPKLLTNQRQARRRRILPNLPRVQIMYPLLQRALGHPVEIVHLQNVILREQLAHRIHLEPLLLERRQVQGVSQVPPLELRLPTIQVVFPHSQRKVHDVHAVHLPHLLVILPPVDVLAQQLRCPKDHPLEVRQLRVVLHFDDHQLPPFHLRQQVHPVALLVLRLPVALALQKPVNPHLLLEQGRKKSLQHPVVGLVAQQPLHRPVEADVVPCPRSLFHSCTILRGKNKDISHKPLDFNVF